jgi:hypothetical protein
VEELTPMTRPEKMLRRVRLELARDHEFPDGSREEVGHILHKRGNVWAFHYDIHGDPGHDEAGYRFSSHAFVPGEYVSIKEQDDVLRTFRVMSVLEVT